MTQHIKTLDRVHPIDEPSIIGTVTSVKPTGRCDVYWDDGIHSNVWPTTLKVVKLFPSKKS